jgi:cell division protein FtsA
MYATTVGLVLTGYRSLDERLNRNYEQQEEVKPAASYYQAAPAPVATPAATPKPEAQKPAEPKKPSGASKFLSDIISRTKGLLIDDFDDKQY